MTLLVEIQGFWGHSEKCARLGHVSQLLSFVQLWKAWRNVDALQEAWGDCPTHSSNPTLKFSLAWLYLRFTYKSLQDEAKQVEPPMETLKAKLIRLKMDLLDESEPSQNDEFQMVRTHICKVELTKENKIRNFSRVTWLGRGDEPYKISIVLLKENSNGRLWPSL